jgi:hypothetical protein
MMRKIIQSIAIAVFTLVLTLLISGVIRKKLEAKNINEKIASLPSFSFSTLGRGEFNSSEIREGPVLIVRFHPECEHCQYEISQILKSDIPDFFSNTLLISSAHPDSIRKFLNRFNYSDKPSVVALADTSDSFRNIFGKDIVPSNYIYNKDLKLVKVLLGEVRTETIRKYILTGE